MTRLFDTVLVDNKDIESVFVYNENKLVNTIKYGKDFKYNLNAAIKKLEGHYISDSAITELIQDRFNNWGEDYLDFSESKSIPRYVSKQRAGDSNLRYFVGQQVDYKVANFIQSTTSDFDKLPLILKNKIQDGNLTYYDLVNYSATAKRINEYTFKMLAEHVFNNNQVGEMTFKDMRDIMENLEEFAALSYVVKEKHENMSIKEMHKLLQKTYNDPELEKRFKECYS